MRFHATIVRVAVAGLAVAACTGQAPENDPKTTVDPPSETVPKKPPPSDKVDRMPPIVIQTPEDIPVALGGAVAPYTPPPPPPSDGGGGASAPAPAPSEQAPAAPSASSATGADAAAAALAGAGEPLGALGATGDSSMTGQVVIAHRHGPGEECSPLTRAEVEKALGDLRR